MHYANIIAGINRRLKEIEKQIEQFDKRAASKHKSKRKSSGTSVVG